MGGSASACQARTSGRTAACAARPGLRRGLAGSPRAQRGKSGRPVLGLRRGLAGFIARTAWADLRVRQRQARTSGRTAACAAVLARRCGLAGFMSGVRGSMGRIAAIRRQLARTLRCLSGRCQRHHIAERRVALRVAAADLMLVAGVLRRASRCTCRRCRSRRRRLSR